MPLLKDIEKLVSKNMNIFLNQISEKYNLDLDELNELWSNNMGKVANKTTKKTGEKRKPSSYINFCSQMRPKLKEENPDLEFKDVGKKLGEMWGALSQTEKDSHKSS